MAAFSELTIDQGATFTVIVTVNDEQGDKLNLTSYTASSYVRKSYYSTTYTSFNVSISDAANGEITLSMLPSVTANLSSGRYVYDLVVTDSSNVKTRVVEGIVVVLPSVTK